MGFLDGVSEISMESFNQDSIEYIDEHYDSIVKPFLYDKNIKDGYLNIWYGSKDNAIPHGPTYFDSTYKDEWLRDSFVREMIKDIDGNSFEGDTIVSPVLGIISPERLSGGVKCLILMYKLNVIVNATSCGENCAKWIMRISQLKPLEIQLKYLMSFYEVPDVKIHIMNNGTSYESWKDTLFTIVQEDWI